MFFGLPVFRGFVLGNFKGCFDILSSFFGFVLWPFYLVIMLISAIKRAHFSYSSQGFSWVFFYRAFLSGSVLSSTHYVGLLCLMRMHTIILCVGDT